MPMHDSNSSLHDLMQESAPITDCKHNNVLHQAVSTQWSSFALKIQLLASYRCMRFQRDDSPKLKQRYEAGSKLGMLRVWNLDLDTTRTYDK